MSNSLARRSVGLLALVLIVAAAIPAAAQFGPAQKMDQTAIQRSWDIQAQLARIDRNKEAFINDFIASWEPLVDRAVFADPATELRPIMEQATPLRLYAASLVGDYNGMIQVLRGEVRSLKVINTLTAPQPHAAAMAPIGSATNSLLFTPIPPCRIADTRSSGARTGILSPGLPRAFDLTTDAFGKGQGGQTACPGLPSFSFFGWSVNLTVTGFSTSGYLQVYPFGGSVPATSILNFSPPLFAIANSSTVTGCYGCSDDINIVASEPTHVILDVYGYFEVATGFDQGTITQFAGTTTTVGAGQYTFVSGGSCPAGTVVVSGSQTNSSSSVNTMLTSDHNISGTTWYEYVKNTGSSPASVTVFSNCQELL